VIAAAGMMLVLLGFTPFTIESGSAGAVVASIVSAALVVLLVAICFAKGRVMHGTIGFFIFPFAFYGACRLGKPGSAWARNRYGDRNPDKQDRSVIRFPSDRRTERFKNAFRDIVGGKPSKGLDELSRAALPDRRDSPPRQ
jgi:hypothetical protein